MRDRKGVDADGRRDGEELRGIEEGEIIIRLYCMKKMFSIKEKRKRNQASKD